MTDFNKRDQNQNSHQQQKDIQNQKRPDASGKGFIPGEENRDRSASNRGEDSNEGWSPKTESGSSTLDEKNMQGKQQYPNNSNDRNR